MARVTFQGRRFPVRKYESVLDALLRGGGQVEHSCRKGSCHVCLLKVIDGTPGEQAQRGLSEEAVRRGYFLPCQCLPANDLTVAPPEHSDRLVEATVYEKTLVAPGIARILLEPHRSVRAQAGQSLLIRAPQGESRSYSIANIPEEDYFLEIHVKRVEGGRVSPWLVDEVRQGDVVQFSGPSGDVTYHTDDLDVPLLCIGTGTGIGPILGVARTALRSGHLGPIFVIHGVRDPRHLYAHQQLIELSQNFSSFRFLECCSSGEIEDGFFGRAVDAAFAGEIHPHTRVYLAGAPDPVEEARVRSVASGVARDRIRSDSFERSYSEKPRDREKIKSLAPEGELWEALDRGKKLRQILEDFYERVYQDEQLSPFFHRVTKQRAIDKQYEFTVDLLSGSQHYFGLGPYNAHHWMVISSELFDYRETLLEECMRRAGLDERLISRWLAVDERFRREIVKASPRGLYVDGEERPVEGWQKETLGVGSICDGCDGEMPAGSVGRVHGRTGETYCSQCAARSIGETLPPKGLRLVP